jgi:AraC-like DNA-binding protein
MTDVSELLGFTAPSAFSRWFRGRFGVSPTEWRSRAQQVPAG